MRRFLFVLLFSVFSIWYAGAQSGIIVSKVVYINDEFDLISDDIGNAYIKLNVSFGPIYQHFLLVSIQSNDIVVFDNTLIYAVLRRNNDTLHFYSCEDVKQLDNSVFITWLVAPISENNLPCEKEFIIQDIELGCNQISTLWHDAIDLIYYDKSEKSFKNMGFDIITVPYKEEEKNKYRALCPYEEFWDLFIKARETPVFFNNQSVPELDFENDDYE